MLNNDLAAKLDQTALSSASDAELLSLFTTGGLLRTAAFESLLAKRDLLSLGHGETGLALRLKAAQMLLSRMVIADESIFTWRDEARIEQFLQKQYHLLEREAFHVLLFGADDCFIDSDFLFWGGLRQSPVYPREVLRYALSRNAASLIVAHNHLSGSLLASQADLRLTRELQALLAAVEIDLVDHYIVTRGGILSLKKDRV